MDAFSVQLSPLFEWLVKTTIQGSVLIGLILLVKIILRGRLPIRWHYFLWLLLLIRLAAPRLPQSRFSIFNLVPESLQTGRVEILPLLWLLGALVMAVIVGARNFTLWRIVRGERPITNQEILDLLEDCKMEMDVRTIVGVVVSDRVKSPVLFGFIRPRLLLPQGILETYDLEELRYIFIHELAHFKQRDIYLGWLMALLQILHWFNPLMWFAFHRMRVDRELACDGLAVSRMDAHEPSQYGRTILNLFERFSQVSYVPSIAGILEDSSKLERRIKMIAKFKKTSRKRSVAAVLVMMALACITLTDAYSAPPFIFGTPTNLGPHVNRGPDLNSSYGDGSQTISANGLELVFASDRPNGFGDYDLYVSTRATTDDDWGTPVNLGTTVNSSALDGNPSISADGLTLYFASTRPGGEGDIDLWVTMRPTTSSAWGAPVNLGSTINSSAWENVPSISADGLSLFFESDRSGGFDIWVATRPTVSQPWVTPWNLGPTVNSSYIDQAPSISADGLSLYFHSYRPMGYGSNDIWVTTRATVSTPWSTPVNLGPTVNSPYSDGWPGISADGLSIYFCSTRFGSMGNWDLYVATRSTISEPFGPPVPLSSLDGAQSVSADGLSLYFASWRTGGYGNIDLWMSTRPTTEDNWGNPVNLGPTVNSSAYDWSPNLSADGLTLFFTSNRDGGYGYSDLWVTTRPTTSAPWGVPVNLGPTVNTSNWDREPSISVDGLSLYFSSYNRSGGYGDYDLWMTTRATIFDPWGTPINLGPTVNTSDSDRDLSISADGLWLFFNSDRPGSSGEGDIWLTTRKTTSDPWGTPVNLGPTVNSSCEDICPTISLDGSMLYFASNRPGGLGGWDIWQVEVAVALHKLPDFNKDGKVDFKDFSFLAYFWSDFSPTVDIAPPPFGDDIIDFKDVDLFAENWLLIMMQASEPNPADGATGIGIDTDLSWTPADVAALHEVHFGIDPYTLPLVATQPVGQESYDPGDSNLIPSTTYYWWINEVNDAGPAPGRWPGVLWSFTTIPGKTSVVFPADGEVIPGQLFDDNIFTWMNFAKGPTTVSYECFFSDNRKDVVNRESSVSLGSPPEPSTPYTYYAGHPLAPPYTESLVRETTYYWCVDGSDAFGRKFSGDIWQYL